MSQKIENKLKAYLPAIFDLLKYGNINWKKINANYEGRINRLKTKYKHSKAPIIKIDATLFDIIVKAEKGDNQALRLLDFFNKIFEELDIYLLVDEKQRIFNTLNNVLIHLDKTYLNFIGELACLNNIIKSGNYRLLAVEEPIDSTGKVRKKIDFKLLNIKSNKTILAEIVNIHLDENNTKSTDNIKNFGSAIQCVDGEILQTNCSLSSIL